MIACHALDGGNPPVGGIHLRISHGELAWGFCLAPNELLRVSRIHPSVAGNFPRFGVGGASPTVGIRSVSWSREWGA